MAQVDNQNNPNDPNNPATGTNQPPAGQQANQPATSGGAGPVTSTGAANVTGQVVGTNNPAQPFQNIASYLTANADKSPQLAQQVAGTVAAPITQASGDIATAADTFGKSVNMGYTPENPNVIGAVADNPTAAAANPKNITDFIANLNDAYTGPSDFTTSPGYADLQAEIANANAAAANTQTQPGIQALLKQTEGPTTTQGINNLDALLLNLDPANLATIQAAAPAAAGLAPALATATATNNANAQAAQAAALKAKTDATAAFDSSAGKLASGVNQKFTDAFGGFKNSQDNLNTLTAGIAQPGLSGLTVRQLLNLGVDPAVIQAYTGLPTVTKEMESAWSGLPDLGRAPGSSEWAFPTVGPAPTVADVASADDYATLAALTQFSGGRPFNAPITADTASLAGTYAPQTLSPTPNNQSLAQDLYGYLNGWSSPAGITPAPVPPGTPGGAPFNPTGGTNTSISDYAALMNGLAQYLGLPAFNPNFPTPTPPAPPSGPPFLGPPGGDVVRGGV